MHPSGRVLSLYGTNSFRLPSLVDSDHSSYLGDLTVKKAFENNRFNIIWKKVKKIDIIRRFIKLLKTNLS